jgi:5-formyltetrahydrofolate cyclo-ligase
MNAAEATARAKSELRLKARAARRALSPEERADASTRIARVVLSLPELRDVSAVLAYGAMPEELDPELAITGLFKRGVRLALPRVIGPRKLQLHWWQPGEQLHVTGKGMREPLPTAPVASVTAIDAVLAPGVAYDRLGWRLGFGAGYYDALFGEFDPSVMKIGVAFEEQVFPELPHDENDRPVDLVMTPRFVYRPRR